MNESQEMAASLLDIIWQGISSDFKSRYRQTIWEQFENTVRANAYTNNLGKFVNSVCLKLGATIPGKHTAEAEKILNSGQDRPLLKLYRDETTLIVLMVRIRNQERRETWEAQQKAKKEFDEMTPEQLFDIKEIET